MWTSKIISKGISEGNIVVGVEFSNGEVTLNKTLLCNDQHDGEALKLDIQEQLTFLEKLQPVLDSVQIYSDK